MRCPKWRWSRRRPAALPQCISSNVHLRFKRLLFGGCTSGSIRGFGCESKAVRWVTVRSRKTVWTYGMCRSEWRIWLETYYGAMVIDLRSWDWYLWMTAMLDLVSHPHSSIPYVHNGFSTVLYKACPSEIGTEVGAPLFPAVELCDFSGTWQCMSGEIWYTLDSGSVLLTETEAR